ncbi:MAG: hypothetical protein U0904_05425 [Candidatus Nanopelagicales bacterium]|nr:hypothetical protein [Candidatus Nanopelagicales bacterium]
MFDPEFREVAVRIVLESGRYSVDPIIQDDVSGEGIEEDVFNEACLTLCNSSGLDSDRIWRPVR